MTYHPNLGRGKVGVNLPAHVKERHRKGRFKDGAQHSLATGLLIAAIPFTGGMSLLPAFLTGAMALGNLASAIPPPGGYKDDNNPDRLPYTGGSPYTTQ